MCLSFSPPTLPFWMQWQFHRCVSPPVFLRAFWSWQKPETSHFPLFSNHGRLCWREIHMHLHSYPKQKTEEGSLLAMYPLSLLQSLSIMTGLKYELTVSQSFNLWFSVSMCSPARAPPISFRFSVYIVWK